MTFDPVGELKARTVESTGLWFSDDGWDGWESRLTIAARELGFAGAAALAAWLLSDQPTPEERERWIDQITVGETYFWRENEAFDALEQQILPALVKSSGGRELRIWSAGCSTGEEAYSLAIALSRVLVPGTAVRLLATDLNTKSLARARQGIYRAWSFRNAPQWLRANHFTETEPGRWRVNVAIQPLFACLNLADGSTFGDGEWDLILCRNVLMYLTPERISEVLGRLHSGLAPDGFLMLSAAELSLASDFTAEQVGGTQVFRRKQTREVLRKAEVPHRQVPAPVPLPPPQLEISSLERVRALADSGRLGEALVLCRALTERDQLSAEGHSLLGFLCEQSGDQTGAVTAYRRALYLDPEDPLASVAMGRLYQQRAAGSAEVRP